MPRSDGDHIRDILADYGNFSLPNRKTKNRGAGSRRAIRHKELPLRVKLRSNSSRGIYYYILVMILRSHISLTPPFRTRPIS